MVPVVVAEIVAGIVFGKSGLGLIHDGPALELFSLFGLAFLMFVSGLEVDFEILSRAGRGNVWRGPLVRAAAQVLIGFGLALLLAYRIADETGSRPVFLAIVLSTTSLGVVLPVLKEMRLTSTTFGQAVLVAALAADFLTMLALTVYVGVGGWGLARNILLLLVLLAVAFTLYRVGRQYDTAWLARVRRASHLDLRGALALMMLFVALSETFGLEMILGAFLGGALLAALDRHSETLEHRLEAMGFGFFIPIFFIHVGATFDLAPLLRAGGWPILLLMLGGAFLLKILPGLALAYGGMRERFAGSLLISSRLSLIIAASAIGTQLGYIGPLVTSGVILLAVVTSAFGPIAFRALVRGVPREKGFEPVVVIGADRAGLMVASRLNRLRPVSVLDPDASTSRLREGGLKTVRHVDWPGTIAIVNRGDDRERVAEAERVLSAGAERAIVLLEGSVPQDELPKGAVGVSKILSLAVAAQLLVQSPEAFSLLAEPEDTLVYEVEVRNAALDGRPLREVALPGDSLVLAATRGDERIVPHGDTQLRLGDRLTVTGDAEHAGEVRGLCGD